MAGNNISGNITSPAPQSESRHAVGIFAFDEFLMVAVDNPRRHANTPELGIGKIGLSVPHFSESLGECIELTWRR